MSTEENKALARHALEEMFNKGNLDLADEVFAPDYVDHDLAMSEDIRGPEGFKEYVSIFCTAFPDLHIEIEDQVAEGDKVVARWKRVKDNRPAAKTGARFWEFSGGICRCASCGWAMSGTRVNNKGRPQRFYYRCANRARSGLKLARTGSTRAERVEAEVWEEVSSLLKVPERLRAGIERYIEQEHRGDPKREMRVWAKRLADVDAKRSRYQDMAAEGLIDFDELWAKLDALETDRKTAVRELEAGRDKAERLASLNLKTEALIEAYSRKARLGLDLYTPEDRFDAYKALGVKILAYPDGKREFIVGLLRSNSESLSGWTSVETRGQGGLYSTSLPAAGGR